MEHSHNYYAVTTYIFNHNDYLNAVRLVEQTLLNVLSQSYPNIEYIVIDGGSTDGTVDIIRRYESGLAYWVSEPDKGNTMP